LMGISMLGVLLFASVAFAQGGVNLQEDPGDNVDPDTGEVVGDDTPDCASFEDVMESGLCAPGSTSSATPSATPSATATPSTTATATASASAAGAAQYQYTPALPSTGGVVSPVGLLAIIPAILLVGGGLLSARLIRRS
jgi:hypothetical protein